MILKVVNLTSNLSDIGEIEKCRKDKAGVGKPSIHITNTGIELMLKEDK